MGYTNWVATDHAVDQFISRWENGKSFAQAKEEVLALLSTSKRTDKSLKGDPIYVSAHRSEIRMVVKEGYVCVTVLGQDKSNRLSVQEEELDELNSWLQEQEEKKLEQITALEKQIFEIDEQRRILGKKKNDISNALQMLRNKKIEIPI